MKEEADTLASRDITWMSAIELTKSYVSGELSPMEVLESTLERVKRYNPQLNAIVTLTEDMARQAAKQAERDIKLGKRVGPLSGIPITIKDLDYLKGVRTTFGSKLYENFIPDEDAVVVERLKKAGAVIIGKTNTPEFGQIPFTDNQVFGPSHNPWDKSRTTGGSSGGAAAAAAAGFGPIAQGSDGAGSIRIPSCFCGIYGMKPSFGRVPNYPKFPGWETLGSVGVVTRTVSDTALALDAIVGPDERDRFTLPATGEHYLENIEKGIEGSKIAYSPDLKYAVVDPEVAEITRKAAFSFEKLGCHLTEIKPDLFNMFDYWQFANFAEMVEAVGKRLEEWKKVMYPLFERIIPLEQTLKARDYARAVFKREEFWSKIRRIFEEYDFLLTPTTAIPAWELKEGAEGPKKIAGKGVGLDLSIRFTVPFNFTGQPAANIPCGFTKNGLPVGLQIAGRRYNDLGVLRASRAFEKAFPWQDKKPPL
jgi:aspartyl-tRNA(Asn)/glutamyl-tRNA(Gln) amidotransferase subunit A